MYVLAMPMRAGKKYRQGQILNLISAQPVTSQDALRRMLAHRNLRVTQATLSRDLQELNLVKTAAGYKQAAALAEESPQLPSLGRALKEFLLDLRPAENLLVLKTPPGGAQPLAAALDAAKLAEVAGTIAGDDTVLIITPRRKSRQLLESKIQTELK